MPTRREGLLPLPRRIATLPLDDRGYPVPYFAKYNDDGQPDFRIADPVKLHSCIKLQLCWICGQKLGAHKAFIVGPTSVINRITNEPPCHRDCAEFAVQSCPFLRLPTAKRREANLPALKVKPTGVWIERNPGVPVIWITKHYWIVPHDHGLLFQIDKPGEVLWFHQGQPAARQTALSAFQDAVELMRELALEDGESARVNVERAIEEARGLLPGC